MEKIGMQHDPHDDFNHPKLSKNSPLCRHVLYRLTRSVGNKNKNQSLQIKLYELTKALEQISNEPESYLFYLNFSKFQASYFYHLDKEETILLPELHKNFDDVRLNAVNQQLLQTMPFESVTTITKGDVTCHHSC
jgi:hemerythrin-like domain-containing protein